MVQYIVQSSPESRYSRDPCKGSVWLLIFKTVMLFVYLVAFIFMIIYEVLHAWCLKGGGMEKSLLDKYVA